MLFSWLHKHWKIISIAALVIIVIVLLSALMQTCNENKTRDKEKKAVEAEKKAVEQREQASNKYVDSVNRALRVQDSIRIATQVKMDLLEQELRTTMSRNTTLIKQINGAKKEKDTILWLATCDSLVTEIQNKDAVIQSYIDYADTLSRVFEGQLAAKDSIIADRAKLYSKLHQSFDKVSDDYLKLLSKKPRQKRWSIGPSVGVGVGADLKPSVIGGLNLTYAIIKF